MQYEEKEGLLRRIRASNRKILFTVITGQQPKGRVLVDSLLSLDQTKLESVLIVWKKIVGSRISVNKVKKALVTLFRDKFDNIDSIRTKDDILIFLITTHTEEHANKILEQAQVKSTTVLSGTTLVGKRKNLDNIERTLQNFTQQWNVGHISKLWIEPVVLEKNNLKLRIYSEYGSRKIPQFNFRANNRDIRSNQNFSVVWTVAYPLRFSDFEIVGEGEELKYVSSIPDRELSDGILNLLFETGWRVEYNSEKLQKRITKELKEAMGKTGKLETIGQSIVKSSIAEAKKTLDKLKIKQEEKERIVGALDKIEYRGFTIRDSSGYHDVSVDVEDFDQAEKTAPGFLKGAHDLLSKTSERTFIVSLNGKTVRIGKTAHCISDMEDCEKSAVRLFSGETNAY